MACVLKRCWVTFKKVVSFTWGCFEFSTHHKHLHLYMPLSPYATPPPSPYPPSPCHLTSSCDQLTIPAQVLPWIGKPQIFLSCAREGGVKSSQRIQLVFLRLASGLPPLQRSKLGSMVSSHSQSPISADFRQCWLHCSASYFLSSCYNQSVFRPL